MHRTVGAVRHNNKLAATQKYDAFMNGCCNGRGLFFNKVGYILLTAILFTPGGSSIVQYSTVQYSTVQYSTVQYSTVHNYSQAINRST